MAKTIKKLSEEHNDIQKTLRQLAKKAKEHKALLPDNLTTGALNGIEEKEFVDVDLSELLQYIADLM